MLPAPVDQKQLVRALHHSDVLAADGAVEVVETHISWILLTRDTAWKIKKAVDLGFVNFTDLAARRHYCEEELRLNKRFAPDLYKEVVAFTNTADAPCINGSGPALEYAVRMQRFDRQDELHHRVQRGETRIEDFARFARDLVAKHADAAAAEAGSAFASYEALMKRALDNFGVITPRLVDPSLRRRVAVLARWTRRSLARHQHRFAARKQQGRVRECHGDLHLGNLVYLDQRITAFDCLEFSETLRWIDVASELAFLYMDLVAHGRDDLARCTLNAYLDASGDYEIVLLLRHYLVYRAMVRCKVSFLQQTRPIDLASEATAYLELAERFARHRSRPRLLVTHGLSGCGKTWFSRRLAHHANLVHLRSDVVRQTNNAGEGLLPAKADYTPEGRKAVYRSLEAIASELLRAGWAVVVDATFLDRSSRQPFADLAARLEVPFHILDLQAPPAVLEERIRARLAQQSDASEATVAVLHDQQRSRDPLTDDEQRQAVRVDTGGDLDDQQIAAIARELDLPGVT